MTVPGENCSFREFPAHIFAALIVIILTIAPAHAAFQLLYTFTGGTDGSQPSSPLIRDSLGNLYGTTAGGGKSGFGTVFKVAPDGTETVLYSFKGGTDGDWPVGLTLGNDGNFYGATRLGGNNFEGNGTVFRLTPDGVETVLYAFKGGTDGQEPMAGVVMDAQGNLYGTTYYGGNPSCGSCGIVYKVTPQGSETVLHSFTGGSSDGANSVAGVTLDGAGNLYGTTTYGGSKGRGVIFELAADSTYTVLYNFTNGPDGANPNNTLLLDSQGNLFGTTVPLAQSQVPYGTVYKFVPASRQLSTLFAFGTNTAFPTGVLSTDGQGNLYGTTFTGVGHTSPLGTVFKLEANGTLTTLHSFWSAAAGAGPTLPAQGVTLDGQGNIYGTTSNGGAHLAGTVFVLRP